MYNRLVSFSVEHPQLEFSPREGQFGKKKAPIWKNLGSPALMLGSVHIFSPTNSPVSSPFSHISRMRSPHSELPHQIPKHQSQPIHELFRNFPRYTRSNPKYTPSNPIVESFTPRRRMGDLATHIILNRKSVG